MSHPDCFCESYYGYICEHCRNSWRRTPAAIEDDEQSDTKTDDPREADSCATNEHQCNCRRINHECHERPAQTQLKDLSLTVKLIDHNAEIWTVIKHEPEVQRVKLRKEGPGMHPEWDAPEWLPVTLQGTMPQGPIWRLHDELLECTCPRPTAQNEAMDALRFAGDLVRAQQLEHALRWIDKAREIVGGMAWRREAEP